MNELLDVVLDQTNHERGNNEDGRKCQRPCCNALMSDKNVHCRVRGKPYCKNSMLPWFEWLKSKFPNEAPDWYDLESVKRNRRME